MATTELSPEDLLTKIRGWQDPEGRPAQIQVEALEMVLRCIRQATPAGSELAKHLDDVCRGPSGWAKLDACSCQLMMHEFSTQLEDVSNTTDACSHMQKNLKAFMALQLDEIRSMTPQRRLAAFRTVKVAAGGMQIARAVKYRTPGALQLRRPERRRDASSGDLPTKAPIQQSQRIAGARALYFEELAPWPLIGPAADDGHARPSCECPSVRLTLSITDTEVLDLLSQRSDSSQRRPPLTSERFAAFVKEMERGFSSRGASSALDCM